MKKTWIVCGAVALALGMTGCDGAQKQNAVLLSENESLKQQLAERSTALEAAERDKQAAIAQARAAEQRAQETPADGMSAGEPTADAGAFAGIEGVTATGQGADIHVSIEGDVLFDSGKDSVKQGAKKSLDKIIGILKDNYSTKSIDVAGFTDTDPIKFSPHKDNYYLGFARAYAVREYLISKGIDGKRVSLSSFGPDQPRDTKSKSRRVEIVVVGD
jgi:outer membrane protein OmpA-like peptidoglycan-associated protein